MWYLYLLISIFLFLLFWKNVYHILLLTVLLTPTKINVSRKRYKATKRMNRETAAKRSGSYNSGRPVATDFAQTSHNPAEGRPEAGWSGSDNSGTAWELGSKLNSEAGDAHEAGTEFFSSIRENSVGWPHTLPRHLMTSWPPTSPLPRITNTRLTHWWHELAIFWLGGTKPIWG